VTDEGAAEAPDVAVPGQTTMDADPSADAVPAATPAPVAPPETAAPRLESTRRLIGASFDLLGRATEEMRRASFYIGAIVLGTMAPFALATWALEVRSIHLTVAEADALYQGTPYIWYGLLAWPAIIGLFVAAFESRIMAVSILGARLVGDPLTVHQALARSRMTFWRAIAVGIIAGVPVSIAQGVIDGVFQVAAPLGSEGGLLATVLATALVGAPFAYVLSGVVMGDVGALEATRRSFRVYRVRKVAAVVVALFEVAAFLLILLGLSAGLDVALRVFSSLGLGADSGPAGLVLVTVGIVAVTFAFGTLLFTVTALSLAPQVVMFVGLTHATMGLEHVRPGGDHDPSINRPNRRPFRVITRSMWLGIVIAWLIFVVAVAQIAG
jgi:hypothetical protein